MNDDEATAHIAVGASRRITKYTKIGLAVASVAMLFLAEDISPALPVNLAALLAFLYGTWVGGRTDVFPRLTVSGDHFVAGPYRIPLRAVLAAYVTATLVEIEVRGGDRYTVRCESVEEARALVEQLGFGGRQRLVVDLRERSIATIGIGAMLYALASGALQLVVAPHHLVPASALLALAVYEIARRLLKKDIYAVGSDGIFRDGKRITIGDLVRRSDLPRARREALLAHFRKGDASVDPDTRAHYRVRIAAGGPFREGSVATDEALDVLRARESSREERLGAAIALRDAGETACIRVAADEMVEPGLREELTEIANEDGGSRGKVCSRP